MEERVNAALNREGALESLEIKGTITPSQLHSSRFEFPHHDLNLAIVNQ